MEIIKTATIRGETFTCRRAGLSDYDGVMAISDTIYEGLDYLPALYRSFVHSPRWMFYVVETNGRIVGFRAIRRQEGEYEYLAGAARIHPDYKGFGLLNLLKEAVKELERVIWLAVFNREIYDKKIQNGVKLRSQWNYVVLRSTKQELLKIRQSSYTVLCPHVASTVLCNEDNCPVLFHGRCRVIIGHTWIPYEITNYNMKHVAKLASVVADEQSAKTGKVDAIALYDSVLTLNNGTASSVMYYGVSDEGKMLQCLFAAFRHLAQASPEGKVNIFCHLRDDTDVDRVVEAVNKECIVDRVDKNTFRADKVAVFSNI